MIPEFIVLALFAGLAVAMVAGPLGCFVVWRRMAYFGDTLAHSALLGVSFGWLFDININIAVTCGCLILALLLVMAQQKRFLATDTLLGILSHATLALGLVIAATQSDYRLDITAYLFGDLLAVEWVDAITIGAISVLVLLVIVALWRPMLAITVDEDLAHVENVPVFWVRASLMLLMALVIAIAMKVVGVLLITALLIIPAATSRKLSKTPEQMAIFASLLGMTSVIGGLTASYFWDSPAGPSIVLCAAILFLLSLAAKEHC
ncbi:zinc ABC transporter permease subunit ZnuB [Halioxenophilus aromaticivorans]|uniref:High-affinity zinc uptake system membrane protein ZnuB n=1 Tax=Halioxenophilus aromaticivorans TaxID=1306992 RepID=A0AAV3U8T8_9ALTE